MRSCFPSLTLCGVLLAVSVSHLSAASKPHVITFGKWTSVKMVSGPGGDTPVEVKVRALYVDAKLKEYTFGPAHEVTERVFAVRRMVRINDALPDEATLRWAWQRGGWVVVDRGSGHSSQAMLPEFDPDLSSGSWFRDYLAYCGVSEDGKKQVAVVVQLGRRKPVLKKSLGEARGSTASGADCAIPTWQRQPVQVNFAVGNQKFTYTVGRHALEIANDADDDDAAE